MNASRREFFEMFARVSKIGRQASIRNRTINTIEVLYSPQDPSWPAVNRRLDALAEQGIGYKALARELAGNPGYIQVTSHFEQLQQREDDRPDLLLIVADPVEGDFLRFLDDLVTAAALLMIDLPVVVGARPGLWGFSLHRPAFAAAEAPLPLAAYRAALGILHEPTDAWVRVAVVDAVGSSEANDMTYELADPAAERESETLEVALTVSTMRWLSDHHGVDGPWRSLLGYDIVLLLRAIPSGDTARIELIDIAPDWLDSWRLAAHRDRMALLVGMGVMPGQRGRQIRQAIRRVDVLRDDDAPWTATGTVIHALGLRGTACRDVLRLATATATSALAKYFERLAMGGIERPDAVLVTVTDKRPPTWLNDLEVVLFAANVQVPIILGADRPRDGSLLHEVVFGPRDNEADAAALLETVVDDGLKAEAHARRVQAFLREVGRRR